MIYIYSWAKCLHVPHWFGSNVELHAPYDSHSPLGVWHLHIYIYTHTYILLLGPQVATFNRRVFPPILHTQALFIFYFIFIFNDFLTFFSREQRGLQSLEGWSHTWMMITDFHPKLYILIQTLAISYSCLWLGTSREISNMKKIHKRFPFQVLESSFNERSPNLKKHCIEDSLLLWSILHWRHIDQHH